MKLPCSACHTTVEKAERAGFPKPEQCLVCHNATGEGRAGLPPSILTAKYPQRRAHRVPDFVIFSHARHRAAKVECAVCHGNVNASDMVKLEIKLTMKFCVDCHIGAKATVVCVKCHELNQ